MINDIMQFSVVSDMINVPISREMYFYYVVNITYLCILKNQIAAFLNAEACFFS